MHKVINILLLFIFFFYGHIASAQMIECTEIGRESAPGFGAAHNLFSSSNELLLRAECGSQDFIPIIGSSSITPSNFWVFTYGYYYDGSEWNRFLLRISELGPSTINNLNWISGNAIAMPIPYQGDTTFYVVYTCHLVDGSWRCGCSDTACTQQSWQLQQITRPQQVDFPPVGGGGFTREEIETIETRIPCTGEPCRLHHVVLKNGEDIALPVEEYYQTPNITPMRLCFETLQAVGFQGSAAATQVVCERYAYIFQLGGGMTH